MIPYSGYRELNKFTLSADMNSAAKDVARSVFGSDLQKFEFSSYMLNPMVLNFNTSKRELFSKEMLHTLRTSTAVFQKSVVCDIPDRYSFEGIEPIKFSIDTFISIYDYIDECKSMSDITSSLAQKAYFTPLVSLFSMYLPKRGDKYAPDAFLSTMKDIMETMFPDTMHTIASLSDTEFSVNLQQWKNLYDAVKNKVTNFAQSAVKDTVLAGLYESARLISVPAQYQDTSSSYDTGGITFTYGPVIFSHIIIDSLSLEMGPMTIYNSNTQKSFPEYIKIKIDVHTAFRATADLLQKTLLNMKTL